MVYKAIADYGVIGNGVTLALIGLDGSVDWMCLPYMDSPSVFAAILDDQRGGLFCVQPEEDYDSVQDYLPQTNVLKTRFRTRSGEVEVTDFVPDGPLADKHPFSEALLLRRVRGLKGKVPLTLQCSPRFDYGKVVPEWHSTDPHMATAQANGESLQFLCTEAIIANSEHINATIQEGDVVWLGIHYGELEHHITIELMEDLLAATISYWQQWVSVQETGKYPVGGFWQDALDRSALALKLLQFKHSGAIAAAGSCSLPTIIHGERNWDYRFSWVRDTSMTLSVLFELGHTKEVSHYFKWLQQVLANQQIDQLSILYCLRGAVPPTKEEELAFLDGYKGSRPVHIGQFNVGQQQHDIYGELMEMIFSMSRIVGKVDPDFWSTCRLIVDQAANVWRSKDSGIWELRTGPHHCVHSKLMCWVALDRGIKIAQQYGFPAPLKHWQAEREAVKEDVLRNGYHPKRRSFTQHYDTEELDASVLRIPLVGLLPIDDERVTNTIALLEKELLHHGVILRYLSEDGLSGQEHGFLVCLFWYLNCLIRQGRLEEVEAYLRWIPQISNHLGLLGEQYDPQYRQITGNLPQAFSHIGYANLILEYITANRERTTPKSLHLKDRIALLIKARTLNLDAYHVHHKRDQEPDVTAKQLVNVLRGQFYDGNTQRIDYQLIRDSDTYVDFQGAVADLMFFDPGTLETDRHRIAFWINIYNTLVIHGVVAFGVRDSVKEIPLFFDRVQYQVGTYKYTLSDIEHGILRGNALPPMRFRPRFSAGDPRLKHCVRVVDPRIHFTLVCASRSCPPIGVYEENALDAQLRTAAQVFINATTIVEKGSKKVKASKVFQWYRSDFPEKPEHVIVFIASFLYDRDLAEWLEQHASQLSLTYLPYDWRLNR